MLGNDVIKYIEENNLQERDVFLLIQEADDSNKYLTTLEVERILKCSTTKVNKLLALEDFPKINIGNEYRIPRKQFFEFMDTMIGKDIK